MYCRTALLTSSVKFYTTCCGNNMMYRKSEISMRKKSKNITRPPLKDILMKYYFMLRKHVLTTVEKFYQHTVTLNTSSLLMRSLYRWLVPEYLRNLFNVRLHCAIFPFILHYRIPENIIITLSYSLWRP